ncbi:M23 family metallopeptidase [Sphingomonas sp.]|uniref:M23 family metallopeptidase n=1 Tax=Sphingomonas sp. TaxID=28214 RepID=UPI003D6D0CAD
MGSDAKRHLGYELHVTNFYAGTGALRLKRVSIYADSATTPLATFSGTELKELLSQNTEDVSVLDGIVIEGGRRVLLFVWLTQPTSAPHAAYLRHRFEFETRDGKVEVADNVRVAVNDRPPIHITPPLKGGPWLADEGPGNHLSHHWGGVVAIDGQVTIPQRFAIDWFGLDATGHVSKVPRDQLAASSDADWVGFGADVLAVGEGVVRDARDGLADGRPLAPQRQPDNLTSRSLYGNFVVIEIAPGVFAHYAHLRNGSVKVHIGDHVHRGDVIGALGQTGQAGGPHLHFHISDRATFEGSEGLPFQIDGVTRLGSARIDDTLDPHIKVTVDTTITTAITRARPSWLPLDGDLVAFTGY